MISRQDADKLIADLQSSGLARSEQERVRALIDANAEPYPTPSLADVLRSSLAPVLAVLDQGGTPTCVATSKLAVAVRAFLDGLGADIQLIDVAIGYYLSEAHHTATSEKEIIELRQRLMTWFPDAALQRAIDEEQLNVHGDYKEQANVGAIVASIKAGHVLPVWLKSRVRLDGADTLYVDYDCSGDFIRAASPLHWLFRFPDARIGSAPSRATANLSGLPVGLGPKPRKR